MAEVNVISYHELAAATLGAYAFFAEQTYGKTLAPVKVNVYRYKTGGLQDFPFQIHQPFSWREIINSSKKVEITDLYNRYVTLFEREGGYVRMYPDETKKKYFLELHQDKCKILNERYSSILVVKSVDEKRIKVMDENERLISEYEIQF